MGSNDDIADSLEQLLESLIKMVGRANKNHDVLHERIKQMNENMDSLHTRISQLEWIVKGQLKERYTSPIHHYPTHLHSHTTSEVHDKIPVLF